VTEGHESPFWKIVSVAAPDHDIGQDFLVFVLVLTTAQPTQQEPSFHAALVMHYLNKICNVSNNDMFLATLMLPTREVIYS
jgi:hypothetical protein